MRMRSSAEKAACPSFMCTTSGSRAQRDQRAVAADSQQNFLLDAVLVIAAIKLIGDRSVVTGILSIFVSSK